jgi:protein gp37
MPFDDRAVRFHLNPKWGLPFARKKPTVYAVQWLGDLFHEDVEGKLITFVYKIMRECPQHVFLVLTKRAMRPFSFYNSAGNIDQLNHIYHGVSICNQKEADEKIPLLLQIPGPKWVSLEPLLGPVDINSEADTDYLDIGDRKERRPIDLISFVVAGGETGPKARPSHPDWFRSVRDQCQEASVPFWFKGWGEWIDNTQTREVCEPGCPFHTFADGIGSMKIGHKNAGRLLDGKEWSETPELTREVT